MQAYPWIRTVHRVSGTLLIGFVLVHVANHLAALHSVGAHQAFMSAARVVYRAPFVEPLLFAAVAAQIATGIMQLHAGRGRRHGFWPRLQAVSGGYLMFFLAVHTSAILVVRWFGLDSNFYAAAMVLTIPPLPPFYAPYYALGICAAFAHLACAMHSVALRRGVNLDRACAGVVAIGVILSVPLVAAFSGAFYVIDLPQGYRDAVARFL